MERRVRISVSSGAIKPGSTACSYRGWDLHAISTASSKIGARVGSTAANVCLFLISQECVRKQCLDVLREWWTGEVPGVIVTEALHNIRRDSGPGGRRLGASSRCGYPWKSSSASSEDIRDVWMDMQPFLDKLQQVEKELSLSSFQDLIDAIKAGSTTAAMFMVGLIPQCPDVLREGGQRRCQASQSRRRFTTSGETVVLAEGDLVPPLVVVDKELSLSSFQDLIDAIKAGSTTAAMFMVGPIPLTIKDPFCLSGGLSQLNYDKSRAYLKYRATYHCSPSDTRCQPGKGGRAQKTQIPVIFLTKLVSKLLDLRGAVNWLNFRMPTTWFFSALIG
uniref:Uncharacterized protein n=1 Tax=Branchiostoma floridae TaxID=7739 RepID=C3ZV03_BRAFL|eukprot:XP_002587639.1 hypothetical protein BRAFLDRAFT_96480 [Branchiostoma floridae]